jgi:serine phosphatase RsbU (regulator of sigma subunit)
MKSGTKINICLVDDDEDYYVITKDLLNEISSFSFKITWIDTYEKAIADILKNKYDVILLDYMLGARNGLELLQELIDKGITTPIIMLTGQKDREIDLEAMNAGAADYLVKGAIDSVLLERSIRYSIEHFKIMAELRKSRDSLNATKHRLEIALKNINEELETAKLVQKSFLPQNLNNFSKIDVFAIYLPSGHIGGDMYDVLKLDENRFLFLVIDVCGHGVPAALITAMTKISFGRYITANSSPKDIFFNVNQELCKFMPDGRYVTGFITLLDLNTKELTYCRAGHPPAIYADMKKKKTSYLSLTGPLIGAFSDSSYEESKIKINNGDIIAFYTDGVIESINENNERYSTQIIEEIILNSEGLSSQTICSNIVKSLKSFTRNSNLTDDITLLVVKIL